MAAVISCHESQTHQSNWCILAFHWNARQKMLCCFELRIGQSLIKSHLEHHTSYTKYIITLLSLRQPSLLKVYCVVTVIHKSGCKFSVKGKEPLCLPSLRCETAVCICFTSQSERENCFRYAIQFYASLICCVAKATCGNVLTRGDSQEHGVKLSTLFEKMSARLGNLIDIISHQSAPQGIREACIN